MGKRSNKNRRRQGDPYYNEETGTSEEEIGKKCTHLAKGLNLPQLKKIIIQGFKLQECEDCVKIVNFSKADAKSETENESNLDPEKKDLLENSEIKINEEKKEADNDEEKEEKGSWICLQCGHRGCGRNEQKHALSHFKIPHSSSHDLAVDSLTWMTWCYKCDDYVTVDSSRLNQAIDFIRKQSGLSGKPEKISASIRRSQSQYDTSPSMANGFSNSNKLGSSTEKGSKNKFSGNELGSLPPVKGLTNLGNTCFFNSVMQVLSQTHWLTQLLDLEVRDGNVAHLRGSDAGPSCTSSCSTLSELDNCDSGVSSLLDGENHEECTVTEPIDVIVGPGKPLTLTLASFLKDMHCPAVAGSSSGKHRRQSSSSTVTPSSLFSQISKKSPQFRGSQQQDAHELLRHLLDGVRTEEITRRRHAIMNHFNLPVSAVKNQPIDVDPVLKRKLKIYGKESAHTFVDQLFGGQLLSTLICETCHQPYQILEPFMDLSLPVSEDKTPPACSKRNKSAGVVDSMVCLTPSSPVLPTKSKLKKERKARRQIKGKKENKVVSNVISNFVEEPKNPIELMEKSASETCLNEVVAVNIEDELEEGSISSGREEEEDEDEGGDVEDNTEEINDLITEMKRVGIEVGPEQEEDSASQHQMDSVAVSGNTKKIRSEWIANSLCSLAVRYQPTNQECSVLSCLNLFTAPELLTGSNKYGCENCTKKKAAAAVAEGAPEGTKTPTVYSVASKQLLIFAPPAILTLHLKRFTQNGITLRKAQKHVEFPLRFDLAPFCSAASAGVGSVRADQKEIIYSLYAVINHSGRLSQGHYTAFVKVRPVASDSLTKFLQQLPMQTDDLYRLRDQLSERLLAEKTATSSVDSGDSCSPPTASKDLWYYCSDSHVTTASEEQVLRSQAFLLFYERVL